jgi:hypothetical protein
MTLVHPPATGVVRPEDAVPLPEGPHAALLLPTSTRGPVPA